MILYFDCFSGITARLALGALADAQMDTNAAVTAIAAVCPDCTIKFEKTEFNRIDCTRADIFAPNAEISAQNAIEILNASPISASVKGLCEGMLTKLRTVLTADFAALVGVCTMICDAAPAYIMSSALCDTMGVYNNMPTPLPDVLAMYKSHNIPYKIISTFAPLVTADGAAVIACCVKEFGTIPEVEICEIGYGTDGERLLRVLTGKMGKESVSDFFDISLEASEIFSASCTCGR